jgi:nitrite reductase (NO-forming)
MNTNADESIQREAGSHPPGRGHLRIFFVSNGLGRDSAEQIPPLESGPSILRQWTRHHPPRDDADIPHSMDFHAAQLNPKDAFKSVVKGQSLTFTFKPKYARAFMYHCGTAPVLMHIRSGMFGAIIVSPREPLAPAKEFVLVQNEFYLADAANRTRASDYQKMLNMLPDIVAFNARPNQYVKAPIRVKVGDRVRFWVVSAGPSHPCNFYVVGDQFDTVYLGSPPGDAIRGVQTFTVPPGGGMAYELMCDVAGEFPFVNHGRARHLTTAISRRSLANTWPTASAQPTNVARPHQPCAELRTSRNRQHPIQSGGLSALNVSR